MDCGQAYRCCHNTPMGTVVKHFRYCAPRRSKQFPYSMIRLTNSMYDIKRSQCVHPFVDPVVAA